MITQSELLGLFNYEEGKLYWKVMKGPRVKVNSEAGSVNSEGYQQIRINSKFYKAHRLIWLYCFGYTPEGDIDHINRNKLDNRIENLREVSRQCNMRNRPMPCNNTSSVVGVIWVNRDKLWKAQVQVSGKTIYLGAFDDFTEAVAHRLAAEQALDWSGCHDNSTAYQHMNSYLKGGNSCLKQ